MSSGPPDRASLPAGRAAIARRLRDRLGPVPRREEWPPISIVVVNRDGEEHLRLLLPRLATATDYPRFEVVLVDNASSDGSLDFARSLRLPFPLAIVENDENLSFSDANNDGAERAAFEHLLFLNNDVEPFEPGWLKELVACMEKSGAAATGATLLHGDGPNGPRDGGYVVQHRRVEFAGGAGFVTPRNGGDGELLGAPLGDAEAAASTAACLLVRRDVFERVGSFTTGYLWGWEDLDLSLKLASAGEGVVCSGLSHLFHRESSTRSRAGDEWQRRTRAHNRRLFAQRWGPQIRREYLLDRLSGRGFWSDGRPPLLAVVLADRSGPDREARELADAVEDQGWRVVLAGPPEVAKGLPEEADFVLLTDPSLGMALPANAACAVWVRDGAEAWAAAPVLRRAELTLVEHLGAEPVLEGAGVSPLLFGGAVDAARLLALLGERAQRLRFCVKLSRDWSLEPAARTLRRSLDARGHATSLQLADEWELLGGMTADVAIALGDAEEYWPKPAQLNVLWTREAPRPTLCDRWDLVLLPDEAVATDLATRTPTAVAAIDLDSNADPAERLLELVSQVAAQQGVPPARIAAQGSQSSVSRA